MAASKKRKSPKQVEEVCPRKQAKTSKKVNLEKNVGRQEDPDKYYSLNPAWSFASCDKEKWSLFSSDVKKIFFDDILFKMRDFETQTWADIFRNKKNNHRIDVETLNSCAVKRLADLQIEEESIISLRFQGQQRMYGHIIDRVFHILWFDLDHGDTDTCVCRSRKRNT